MIKEDFATSLNFLREENLPFNKSINNDMDAVSFNSIFTDLEDYLNNLYEKTRVLEEIYDYTLNFLKTAIEERRRQINSDLKIIEMSLQSLNDNNSIISPIDFTNYTSYLTDRDGSELPHLVFEDGYLSLDGTEVYQKSISNIVSTGEFLRMERQVDSDTNITYCNYSEGMEYRPVQIEADSFRDQILALRPIKTEIRYEIYFTDDQGKCNYLGFTPINCEVTDIKIVDTEDMSQDISKGKIEDQYIQKIVLRVKPLSYETEEILISTDGSSDYLDIPVSSKQIISEAML